MLNVKHHVGSDWLPLDFAECLLSVWTDTLQHLVSTPMVPYLLSR